MNDALHLMAAVLGGIALGGVFFGGLWWTTRRALRSGHPAAWLLGSLLLRTAIVVCGFYLGSRGDWRRLLACLVGFTVARVVVMRFARVDGDVGERRAQGGAP